MKKIIILLLAATLINLSLPAQTGRSKAAVERAKASKERSKTFWAAFWATFKAIP